MRTVIVGEHAEVDALIARRRAMGHDRLDEVWDGEYHMAPAPNQWHSYLAMQIGPLLKRIGASCGLMAFDAFNLGGASNYRVPDLGLVRQLDDGVWVATAAMVVEVVSPGDESWLKFDHYAAHGVDEVLIADPGDRTLHLFVLVDGAYQPADSSVLLGVSVVELHAAIDWPGAS